MAGGLFRRENDRQVSASTAECQPFQSPPPTNQKHTLIQFNRIVIQFQSQFNQINQIE